jgi:hypothetical protein
MRWQICPERGVLVYLGDNGAFALVKKDHGLLNILHHLRPLFSVNARLQAVFVERRNTV